MTRFEEIFQWISLLVFFLLPFFFRFVFWIRREGSDKDPKQRTVERFKEDKESKQQHFASGVDDFDIAEKERVEGVTLPTTSTWNGLRTSSTARRQLLRGGVGGAVNHETRSGFVALPSRNTTSPHHREPSSPVESTGGSGRGKLSLSKALAGAASPSKRQIVAAKQMDPLFPRVRQIPKSVEASEAFVYVESMSSAALLPQEEVARLVGNNLAGDDDDMRRLINDQDQDPMFSSLPSSRDDDGVVVGIVRQREDGEYEGEIGEDSMVMALERRRDGTEEKEEFEELEMHVVINDSDVDGKKDDILPLPRRRKIFR
eukprot:TRINITY_DN25135_c0_g1_i1.p1 TRINITY_DN25135_c0_g1~~TRINITY_DN25135_c0_g1_i1.p1  ORF type:complete len:338 (+),score=116.15 TRINITY_DN25135_c0_g1_i1:69-1016(+)